MKRALQLAAVVLLLPCFAWADVTYTGACVNTNLGNGVTCKQAGYYDSTTAPQQTQVSLSWTPSSYSDGYIVEAYSFASTQPTTETMTFGTNVNNPDSCFAASPHSPLIPNPTATGNGVLYFWYCPKLTAGSGVTSLIANCTPNTGYCGYLSFNVIEVSGACSTAPCIDQDGVNAITTAAESFSISTNSSLQYTAELSIIWITTEHDETNISVTSPYISIFTNGSTAESILGLGAGPARNMGIQTGGFTWSPADTVAGAIMTIKTAESGNRFWHVQGNCAKDSAGNGTATSESVVLPAVPTQGNTVAVALPLAGASGLPISISVKDGNSNSYTVTPNSPATYSTYEGQWMAYLLNAPANASATINATWTNGAYAGICADEFAASGSVTFDKDAAKSSGAASGTTANLPSLTPTYSSGELLYSGVDPGADVTAPAAGAALGSWTGAAGGIIPSYGMAAEYDLSATSATAVDYTVNTSGSAYAAMSVAFYASMGTTASLSETNTASSALGRVAGFNRADSETSTASDALARLTTLLRGDSETNTASDALGRVAGFSRADSETNPSTDGLARLATLLRGDSETNTASDALGRVAVFSRADSETNTASDALARLAGFTRADTEANTAGDTLARLVQWLRADAETNTAQDSLGAVHSSGGSHAYTATPSETNTASDILARLASWLRGDTETNTAGDVLGRAAAYLRGATESGAASDMLGRLVSFFRSDSESNPSTDRLSRLRTSFAALAETNIATDTLARLGTFARGETETLSFAAVISVTHSGNIIVLPRHAGTVSDRTKAGTATPH